MKVVVTGGHGFLGRHVASRLLADGHEVRTFDRTPDGVDGAEAIVADVRDERAVELALRGVDAVVHAAFAPPQASAAELHEVNVAALDRVGAAAAALGVTTVVVVSSTIVERRPRAHPWSTRLPLSRLDAYRQARLEGEEVALAWSDRLEVAVARPQTFLGPGRVGAFALVFDLVLAGRPVPVFGPGTNRYQLLDVRDLAAGLARLAGGGNQGVFHFGAPEVGSVDTVLHDLIAHAGTGAHLLHVPAPLALAAVRAVELAGLAPLSDWHHATARRADRVSDTSRASAIGWLPRWTNQACLEDAYDWFAESRRAGQPVATTHPVPGSHRLAAAVARVAAVVRPGGQAR